MFTFLGKKKIEKNENDNVPKRVTLIHLSLRIDDGDNN